ncbi:MAG: OmpA family protein [Elusimicrobiota bacterium]|nr:OmpA family protein [Elusimicrobiota bacterium]
MKKTIALCAALLTGCAGAQLEKQKKEIEDLQVQAGAFVGQLKDKSDEIEALKASKAELEGRVTELEGKLAAANGRLDSMSKSNSDLSSALKSGKDALAAKLNDAIAEKDDAAKRLSEALKEKLALERLKNVYKSAKDKTAADLARLETERAKLVARLTTVDEAAKKDDEARSAARARAREEMGSVADAVLKELQSGKASAEQDGESFSLTLADGLVFEDGSEKVTEAGAARLARLAAALKALSGKRLRVEVHTDNAPFKKGLLGGYDGHWELSAARATAAARWLHLHGGLDPAAIEAVAMGEFRPVKPNDTPQGRAANRRLVLVVSPR